MLGQAHDTYMAFRRVEQERENERFDQQERKRMVDAQNALRIESERLQARLESAGVGPGLQVTNSKRQEWRR